MDSKYFGQDDAPFMFNYRVDDLDVILARLRAEGVEVLDKRDARRRVLEQFEAPRSVALITALLEAEAR